MSRQSSLAGWAGSAAVAAALACHGLEAREQAARLVTEIEPARVAHRPPRFISVAPAMAREGEPYRYGFAALDPEGEALSFTLVRAPAGAVLEGRLLKWTPGHHQAGRRERFTLRAMDEHGASRLQSWTVIPRAEPAVRHPHRRHR